MYFCNIDFNIHNLEQLFQRKENETKCIATVNAQFIVLANTDKRYMNYINNNYSTFDGEVPLKSAKKKDPAFNEFKKLPGSEIVYDFAQYAKDNNLKLFFLGGKQESNTAAVKKIKEKYEIEIEGFSPDFENYPFSEKFTNECLNKIKEFKPQIIFVGFGAPKQEFFIEDNIQVFKELGVQYLIGSGGTFEFVSGVIQRAPKWVQKAGLEGLFRLFKEFNLMRIKRIIYSFRFFKYINKEPDWKS